MTLQEAYQLYPDPANEGQLVSAHGMLDAITVPNGSTPIPFGRVVSYDADGKVALGGASSSVKIGIAPASHNVRGSTTNEYPADRPMPVYTKGRIWVRLVTGSSNAPVGATPLYSTTTGEVRYGTGTINGYTALTNATFETSGSAGDLVQVRLDI